jgi:hypothetical protein
MKISEDGCLKDGIFTVYVIVSTVLNEIDNSCFAINIMSGKIWSTIDKTMPVKI